MENRFMHTRTFLLYCIHTSHSFLPGYMRQDSMGAQMEVKEHHDPQVTTYY